MNRSFSSVLDDASGGNPFHTPISNIVKQIGSTKWAFPYFHNIVMILVCTFLILIFSVLYSSVGIASQIVSILGDQINYEKKLITEVSSVEKSSHVMAVGIYSIIAIPFWGLQVPFLIIAWAGDYLIKSNKLVGLILSVSVTIADVILYTTIIENRSNMVENSELDFGVGNTNYIEKIE